MMSGPGEMCVVGAGWPRLAQEEQWDRVDGVEGVVKVDNGRTFC